MTNNLFLFATEIAEHSGFGINTDIFQTNLINIVIILGLLVYSGRGFLGKILSQRLESIETAIKDAETRKLKAEEQLKEQQQKLAEVKLECDRLKLQAEIDAKAASEAILATIASDIERLKVSASQELASEQERIIIQLRQQVAQKALAQVKAYFDQGLSDSTQQQLVDRSISLLVNGGAR
ncbi:F0F1-type ATP synthase, beta subunit [Synechococcus sp. PCC 7502]|uniref:F0F1 ATP synthase subunit B n=1 Tax=Synechococcus sp. PCC 7502 TaxID=1173263 RepID=UPI00029FE66E|nr:F0F1 ATP synthase subunit B [Synechococcus sp. PCC 7502]AFY74731.1 F0F1-type ATP synthase, beta subunit [Synechococcus sp. PCC 7502]